MKIDPYKVFRGQHCETNAIGNLLANLDVNLSEPMLFGLGSGLGYIFWNMKMMDFPFMGGRISPDSITENVCWMLNLKLNRHESSSVNKAWKDVKDLIDQSVPVALKLDSYYLEYFTSKIHFAGHYATLYGYDEQYAYLADTVQQGSGVKTSLASLAMARNAKGPMSSRNLYFTIEKTNPMPDLKEVIPLAIAQNARDFLNPPIKNIGYKGIEKTAKELFKWFDTSAHVENDFTLQAMLMEKAGTGGALFRNLYRDFLHEGFEITKNPKIGSAFEQYAGIAVLWNRVSECFNRVGETRNRELLKSASELLMEISDRERKAMEILEKV